MASGNGQEAPGGRRRFRKRGETGEEKHRPRPGDKLRPGAYLDVLI